MKILKKHFPSDVFSKPRKQQLEIIEQLKLTKKKFVVIKAPVATGKSAIAMTLLNAHDSGYIVTPRKFLQDQYAQDFPDIPILKGKSNYPCETHNQASYFKKSCNECALLPHARNDFIKYLLHELYDTEVDVNVPDSCCPYYKNMRTVMDSPRTICNFHSLWFNGVTMSPPRLNKREILIVDEAHELESLIRDLSVFNVKSYNLPDRHEDYNADQWVHFLTPEVKITAEEEFFKIISGEIAISDVEINQYLDDDTKEPSLSKYIEYKVNELEKIKEFNGYVYEHYQEDLTRYVIKFIPLDISMYTDQLFSMFDKVVFMSGTIFDTQNFSLPLGLSDADIDEVAVDSPIPLGVRPILCNRSLMVNTSFKDWTKNFDQLINAILHILNMPKLKNVKGVIHTSSYKMSRDIADALESKIIFDRIIWHNSNNFNKKFDDFIKSKKNHVFITPICAQGVDFKDDLAKFQMIIRLPYPNKTGALNNYKYENDSEWINYQTLVTLGQQLGRVNRHENDTAITFLMDSRFLWFLDRNNYMIPQYIQDAIIYK